MNPFEFSMMQAMSGMRVNSQRITVSAENVSNADTPGYQRKILLSEPRAGSEISFGALRTALDRTPGEQEFNPSHPMSDDQGYITLSNVSLVTEMADMREANRTYEANLNSFQQARTMYSSLLDVLRR
ncbi:MAG: flagellar basal body rod C-terminal domain-containing protein [Henriciella sp.]|nr:flagellar basal body protein [Hyphomonadaceae bacterium]